MYRLRRRLPNGFDGIWLKSLLILIAVVVVLAVVSLTGSNNRNANFSPEAEGADIFPSESLADWVSYAQQMSVITVVGEKRIEPPTRVYETNEGYVGRTVTIRIDKTVWSADGIKPFADGTELSYTGWGWLYKRGEYRPFAAQLRMGERYLIPIVKGRDSYHPLTSGTRLPLVGERVDPDLKSNNPAVKMTRGKTVDEVGQMLAETSPDPLALKYWHLDPVDRVQAVLPEMYPPEEIEEPIPEPTEVSSER